MSTPMAESSTPDVGAYTPYTQPTRDNTTEPAGGLADALALLHLLFARPGVAGYLEIRLLPEGVGRPEQRFFALPGGVEAAAHFAASMSGRAHVTFGVYPRSRPRGRDDDAALATCLFADLDSKDFAGGVDEIDRQLAGLAERGLAPTAVVASGGGRHAYWLLERPVPLGAPDDPRRDRVRAALWALGAELGLAPAANVTHDLARVLRLPGTLNVKARYGRPVMARILSLDPSRIYRPQDFTDVIRCHPMPASGRAADVHFTRAPMAGVPLSRLLSGLQLTDEIRDLIRRGVRRDEGDRSAASQRAITALLAAGADPDRIRDVFACTEAGIGEKFRERRDGDRWLAHSISRAKAWLRSEGSAMTDAGRAGAGRVRLDREAAALAPDVQLRAILLDGAPAELRTMADRAEWPDARARAKAATAIASALLRTGMPPAAAYAALRSHAIGSGVPARDAARWVQVAEKRAAALKAKRKGGAGRG
ncbi:MAG: hypothetical protein QJR08_00195 [Bacillota bacterium]|nr:hypothetical protein [Bacillota bacterium]